MANEKAAALKAMDMCRTLAPAELDAIAAIVETRDVAAGKDLFREGDPGDGLFLVISGEIDVTKRAPGGEHLLARLGPGGVLGEMSLVTADARSATGRALVDSRVLHMPATGFRTLLAAESVAAHKLVAAVAEVLARRLASMNGLVLELTAKAGIPAADVPSLGQTQKMIALHRKMQIWSF
jgi:CRP/FNR family transcriptional regulator, cyclic AMP receptor protein